jgi:hypothetical protein
MLHIIKECRFHILIRKVKRSDRMCCIICGYGEIRKIIRLPVSRRENPSCLIKNTRLEQDGGIICFGIDVGIVYGAFQPKGFVLSV